MGLSLGVKIEENGHQQGALASRSGAGFCPQRDPPFNKRKPRHSQFHGAIRGLYSGAQLKRRNPTCGRPRPFSLTPLPPDSAQHCGFRLGKERSRAAPRLRSETRSARRRSASFAGCSLRSTPHFHLVFTREAEGWCWTWICFGWTKEGTQPSFGRRRRSASRTRGWWTSW